MPMYNEEDTISTTLLKILTLRNLVSELTFVVQDDCSTDESVKIFSEICVKHGVGFDIKSNERNLGHGPTLHSALRRAIESRSDLVLQLDSDGQFIDQDLKRLLSNSIGQVEQRNLTIAYRTKRLDPLFRRAVTKTLAIGIVPFLTGDRFPDVNSPTRIWRRNEIQDLIEFIPPNAKCPNILLLILAKKQKFRIEWIPMQHVDRNSSIGNQSGTMFAVRRFRVPIKFLQFCLTSFFELVRWRKQDFGRRVQGDAS